MKYVFAGACLALMIASGQADAACGRASTPAALQSFEANPAAWLAANGQSKDLGGEVSALAAAAVNSKDPGFGAALSTLLGAASANQGTAIGAALGVLSGSCSDPRDPNDVADKQYIAANIAPNMRSNANANTAYGQAAGTQTAAIGGVALGGGGLGVGGQTGNGFPSGGQNNNNGFPPSTGTGFTTNTTASTFGTTSGSTIVSPNR